MERKRFSAVLLSNGLKRSRWIACLLCLVMVFAMTACAGGAGTDTPPAEAPAEESSPDTAPDESAPDTSSAEPGDAAADPAAASDDLLADIIPDETLELVIYSQLANYNGTQGGWADEVLKEKFNATVTIINELDGTYATRMAAGDLGDIVLFGNDGAEYLDAVEAGMLFNWEDEDLLATYGSYINEHMQPALEKNRTLSGGNVYGFGFAVAVDSQNHEAFGYTPTLRFDLYNQIGAPEINTLEDFIPVLKEMQALEPTSEAGTKVYGVSSFPDWDGSMVMMVKSTAALYGYDEFGLGLYDTKTQTYEDTLKDGGQYLRALKFYNTMFQEGLYDPDSMTQTADDQGEKYRNGSALFNIFDWMASPFNTPEHLAGGKYMAAVAAKDQINLAYGLNIYGSNRLFTIGANTNYPELCMAILNWFCTPEGRLTTTYGPKGVTWDYNEEGNTYLTELGLQAQQDGMNTEITYNGYTGMYGDGGFRHNLETWAADTVNLDSAGGETYNWSFWKSTMETKPLQPIEQQWRDWASAYNATEYLDNNNHLSLSLASDFSMGTRDPALEATWTQVTTAVKNGSWSAIYAASDAEFDSIVAKMLSDAQSYGYEECVTWTQAEAVKRKEAEDRAQQQ